MKSRDEVGVVRLAAPLNTDGSIDYRRLREIFAGLHEQAKLTKTPIYIDLNIQHVQPLDKINIQFTTTDAGKSKDGSDGNQG